MMDKKRVALLGAGGLALEIVNFLTSLGYIIDYLYDSTVSEDTYFIKGNYYVSSNFKKDMEYVIAVGYPSTKINILKTINEPIIFRPPIISNSCYIGDIETSIGLGSVVFPFVSLTADVIIGRLATIYSMVTICHNCKIGNMFHASPGVQIAGNVTIGDRVFLGINSCIKEKITICNDVIIGAGSVVVKDITIPGTCVGNPARQLK